MGLGVHLIKSYPKLFLDGIPNCPQISTASSLWQCIKLKLWHLRCRHQNNPIEFKEKGLGNVFTLPRSYHSWSSVDPIYILELSKIFRQWNFCWRIKYQHHLTIWILQNITLHVIVVLLFWSSLVLRHIRDDFCLSIGFDWGAKSSDD